VAAFAIMVTVVTSAVAYQMLYPRIGERFFATWILGSRGLAEDYYPNNNPNLRVGEEINWTLGVYNHMGPLEYVLLRVKLLNSSLPSPDELTGAPSPVPPVYEFYRILAYNETWSVAFIWSLAEATLTHGSITITKLSINGHVVAGELASALSGFNFRFVFELWFYDQSKGALSFSQGQDGTNGSFRAVWTQIWFNVTYTG